MIKLKPWFLYWLLISPALMAGCARQVPSIIPSESPLSVLPSPTPGPSLPLAYPYPEPLSMPTPSGWAIPYPAPPAFPTPSGPATPYPAPNTSPEPSATSTPVPSPTSTPTSTPTLSPYNGSPFTIVFPRDGNLWLSEIGGGGERQLTFEPPDWRVLYFDVAPGDDRIAYIPVQKFSHDALIKQVQISSGAISVLAGEKDQCSETDIQWLDDTHIAYRLQEYIYTDYEDDTCQPEFHTSSTYGHTIVDLTTNERTLVLDSLFLSQSPNGRYWLTGSCEYIYECPLEYVLHDRKTGEKWRVAEGLEWGYFLAWSPDSQWMLFNDLDRSGTRPIRHVLVDVTTRKEQWITSENKYTSYASWSPDGRTIVSKQCDIDQSMNPSTNCALWLINRNDMSEQKILSEGTADITYLNWIPDGSRLVFTLPGFERNTHNIWSVKLDGTDLKAIVYDAYDFEILFAK